MQSQRFRATALFCTSVLIGFSLPAQFLPPDFSYQEITDGVLSRACTMRFAPDGRLFVLERLTGNIKLVRDGVLQPGNWASVPTFSSVNTDHGLLGIAFDPDFLNNRYVYVYYTESTGAENFIARLQDIGGVGVNLTNLTPPGAMPGGGHHNGGPMVFDWDGRLYLGNGDRSVPADAQDPASWMGKILRFDPPGMTFPADNPFPNSPVWSLGHRNTFGLAIHPVTGALFQTENGELRWDELNLIVRAGNYGWPVYEGPMIPINPAYVQPLAWYGNRTPDPTGTCFYTGTNYPASYQDLWFWADYDTGAIHYNSLDATHTTVVGHTIFDDLPGQATDLVMGPDGNLWVLHTDAFGQRGSDEIGRYVYRNQPFPALNLSAVSNKSVGGSITVCCQGNDGDIFFTWIAASIFTAPQTTPFGAHWVPVDIVLPVQFVIADQRSYQAISVPYHPNFVGTAAFGQSLRIDATTLQIDLTNPAKLVLH